jgi:hypothetical protein
MEKGNHTSRIVGPLAISRCVREALGRSRALPNDIRSWKLSLAVSPCERISSAVDDSGFLGHSGV